MEREGNYTILYELEYSDANGDINASDVDVYVGAMTVASAEAGVLLVNLCAAAISGGFTAPVVVLTRTGDVTLTAGNVSSTVYYTVVRRPCLRIW